MLLTLDDQILNLDNVSRVFIKETRSARQPHGGEAEKNAHVIVEYAQPIYFPGTTHETPRLKEFAVELYRGSKEECQNFIKNLASVWQSDRKIVSVKDIRNSVGKF